MQTANHRQEVAACPRRISQLLILPFQVTQLAKRLLVVNLSAMSIVVFAYYNADLTTNMTIAPKPAKIGSFEDVANADFIPRTWPNTNHYKILSSGNSSSALGRLFRKLKDNEYFTSNYSFCYYQCMSDLLMVSFLFIKKKVSTSKHITIV